MGHKQSWRRRGMALAVIGASVAIQLTTVSPASAAPSSVVSGASATNSIARKSATAFCPVGTRVYGGGGDIAFGGHEVALSGLRPVSTLVNGVYHDSFVATAEEDESGYAANWTLYAWAICGPALPNLSIRSNRIVSAAGSDRVETGVGCPTGTAPLGLGAEIGNGNGNVLLNLVLGNYTTGANGQPTGWASARAFVDETGYTPQWSLTSYAVCATPPPGLTYKFVDSAYDSADKYANAECPVGTKVYGVGGYLSFLNGQTHFDRMVPHGAQWTGADVEGREDQNGFSNIWWAEVEAICAR